MSYEPLWERFAAAGPDGVQWAVEFQRAGSLTAGDWPELYFFRMAMPGANPASTKTGEEVVVAISGSALKRFEQGRRRLSREEKIDVTGLLLKQGIEAGKTLDSKNLLVRDEELARLTRDLAIRE